MTDPAGVTSKVAARGTHLTREDVRSVLGRSGLGDACAGQRVLVLIPDHTRSAPLPLLFDLIVESLAAAASIEVMVALGTHPPLSESARRALVGICDGPLPAGVTLTDHAWQDRHTLVQIGTIDDGQIRSIAGDRWHRSLAGDLPVRINRAATEADRVVVVGPTFPHEVVGFSGGVKYLFPGISGPEMIDVSHWLGALCGVPDTIGVLDTPPRRLIEQAAGMLDTPVTLVGLVVGPHASLDAVFVGDPGAAWRAAAKESAQRHVVLHDAPMDRVLSVALPRYDELWTAAKAMYKLEPVLADGAELVLFAPHLAEVSRVHGAEIDRIGYHVRAYFLAQWDRFADVPRAALAHATHLRGAGSYVGGVEHPRFTVTLASRIPAARCRRLGLAYRDPDSIDVADWVGREADGVLVDPHAGETLHRLRR